MRINRRVCGLALLATASMMAAGCGGDGGEEAVFLYFINGYAGTGAMTVNGPTGVIAAGVPFGERYGDGESCGPENDNCVPARVERQRGGEFTFVIENMVERAQLQLELFAMYPHETGTLVMTRRADETTVDTTLLRHTQTISSDCTLTLVNGLSASNEYLGTFASLSISPEVREPDIAAAGFGDEANTPFLSECGALPVDDPTHRNLQRAAVLEAIEANPWFMLVCDEDENEEFCKLRWGVPNPDGRVRIDPGGRFPSVLDSEEYFECVEGAISVRAPVDEMTMTPFPVPEDGPDCPTDAMGNPRPPTWADMDVDFVAVRECNEPINRNAVMTPPGQSDSPQSYQGFPICETTFRIRNEGPDIIFGPEDGEELGSHGNGELVSSEIDVPPGSQRFYVLLGRPVNPIVWQWDSSETFVNLEDFPYFNEDGDRPQIGDTDK